MPRAIPAPKFPCSALQNESCHQNFTNRSPPPADVDIRRLLHVFLSDVSHKGLSSFACCPLLPISLFGTEPLNRLHLMMEVHARFHACVRFQPGAPFAPLAHAPPGAGLWPRSDYCFKFHFFLGFLFSLPKTRERYCPHFGAGRFSRNMFQSAPATDGKMLNGFAPHHLVEVLALTQSFHLMLCTILYASSRLTPPASVQIQRKCPRCNTSPPVDFRFFISSTSVFGYNQQVRHTVPLFVRTGIEQDCRIRQIRLHT